eukprot:7382938-Prymnesium_polylepis.2
MAMVGSDLGLGGWRLSVGVTDGGGCVMRDGQTVLGCGKEGTKQGTTGAKSEEMEGERKRVNLPASRGARSSHPST